ncbi:MAG: CRTAC1 family protein [Fuerstiella sp.]
MLTLFWRHYDLRRCRSSSGVVFFALLFVGAACGCRDEPETVTETVVAATDVAGRVNPGVGVSPNVSGGSSITPAFVDVADESGIDFRFHNDTQPGRYFLPEVMGGGAAWFDFDGDGSLDLYLANGASLSSPDLRQDEWMNGLFRNRGNGSFTNVTRLSKSHHGAYSQGCAVGDCNSDGFPDLYVTSYGVNSLFINRGDGTFYDATTDAGVGDSAWGTSVVWFDADADNDADLYVCNYVDLTFDNHKVCNYGGRQGYCGPGSFDGVNDLLYINNGDETFTESAAALGFDSPNGKGLAVIISDFDNDSLPDVYVANDMVANYLYTRGAQVGAEPTDTPSSKTVRFRDVAAEAGCSVGGDGRNEASMGIACADFNNDGMVDIYLTHYMDMKNTLYRNLGRLLFRDVSRRSRIAATSFPKLGFGTTPIDFDGDGDSDLFVANGHVLGPLHIPNRMSAQLLENDGTGRFQDVSASSGEYFSQLSLGRGVAAADYDNDGDVDIAVTHVESPLALLRNDTPTKSHFLGLLLSTNGRTPPVGARLVVTSDVHLQTRIVDSGGSYLCASDTRLLFSLKDSLPVDVEIFWPSGHVDRYSNITVDGYWHVTEGHPLQPLPDNR